MLNCTDLECILHQHHYHHHLHQLHHLHQDGHHAGAGDPASDGDDVLRLLNSTDGELSGLSHLDAPISDSVYIVCGVLIAMVLVGLIIVLLAITISKLRKREETNNNNNNNGGLRHGGQREHGRQLPQLQQLQLQVPDGGKAAFNQGHPGSNGVAILETTVATTTIAPTTIAPTVGSPDSGIGSDLSPGPEDGDGDAGSADGKVSGAPLELFLWSYPSQQHGHELEHPLQRAAISAAKDALVRPLPPEAPQDSKGLRKNLRGKWKRLVKRKPEDTGSIPPELRDQLKQIYVY